ncbi:hypothetical protein MT349_17580 [Rathayibacter caricis]|uniref:hypothetical protein n=1 Tax=Rathayibacter caricis TaxID=110936 RepID=UPI001FB423B8|nr:hypothetical protein [Rathayibacter caricis]MCJ1697596.1 hypothetical protein [Rathayibacter caricis]
MGHGYHKGIGDRAKPGGAIGALVTLGATGIVVGGKWAVGKLRKHGVAKHLEADSAAETSGEDGPGKPTNVTG